MNKIIFKKKNIIFWERIIGQGEILIIKLKLFIFIKI